MRHPSGNTRGVRRAFSIIDLACTLAVIVVLLALVVPALGRTAKSSMLATSFRNLMDLGVAHALYASEWNGRQVQLIEEDISTYGQDAAEAFNNYYAIHDYYEDPHPPIGLGWGTSSSPYNAAFFRRYRIGFDGVYAMMAVPIHFSYPPYGGRYFGSFRLPNVKPFHDYVGGRFYDPTFYAPADRPVWDWVETNGCFAAADEYPDCLPFGPIAWSSYCLSPAALFHPDVMRHPADGGWQDPWSLDHAFETPGLLQARYPALKTFMLEHHWVQNTPKDVCNDYGASGFNVHAYGDCDPYLFNHSIDSAPATLFYDLSVRLLPNAEVKAADQQVQKQTGVGLWSRDTPFGIFGYRIDYGFDGSALSHHILTTDGILGRDTVGGK